MVNTYDPQEINVIVNGTILTGYMDGSFVTVEQTEDDYTLHVGTKGEVSRVRNANKTGTITVTLKQDSPSNSYLNRLAKGRETFPISVVDQNFNTTAGGNDCWIQKVPNVEYGNEITGREWVFVVPNLEILEG